MENVGTPAHSDVSGMSWGPAHLSSIRILVLEDLTLAHSSPDPSSPELKQISIDFCLCYAWSFFCKSNHLADLARQQTSPLAAFF